MEHETNLSNPVKKSLILCFDGTGNRFEASDKESNILKCYRMLDRTSPNQFSWYNPGLGTYVQSSSLESNSAAAKIRSWYIKTKDLAFGSNVGDHVMAGYKFLMRYYTAEDDIYLFGFSRGAYTARFLAEMLDHIELLSAGNEELQRFAWKCFSKWQCRKSGTTDRDKEKTVELYEFMKAFRETFSRPVRRVRFVGLFDTVNSVPRFENAWMARTRFPYTAKTSAKVIRHAVSIDERRAKFRVDLISGKTRKEQEEQEDPKKTRKFHRYLSDLPTMLSPKAAVPAPDGSDKPALSSAWNWLGLGGGNTRDAGSQDEDTTMADREDVPVQNGRQPNGKQQTAQAKANRLEIPRSDFYTEPLVSQSVEELQDPEPAPVKRSYLRRRFSDLRRAQDIEEVWFPGNHGDIGGGWSKHKTETWPLAHQPLVWMVNEAQKAGLQFDPEKMAGLNCSVNHYDEHGNPDAEHADRFQKALQESTSEGYTHDCLEYDRGLGVSSVFGWKIMEWLPFRRMDLQPDGSWKPIRWPLPRGEVRDIPKDAKIHRSVIDRMNLDSTYRPGNLIMLGSGGRGQKIAPKHLGIGQWVSYKHAGDKVNEVYIGKAYADEIGHSAAEGTKAG